MILSGNSIADAKIIEPFAERTRYEGMTYGVGPAGYDVRIEFDSNGSVQEKVMHGKDFMLASTIERFVMPRDVMGIVHDKSSWARKGLTVQNTVIEPGWEGWLTLELVNHNHDSDIILKRGMPIAQVVFHRVDKVLAKGYTGKYQGQARGPVAAIDERPHTLGYDGDEN